MKDFPLCGYCGFMNVSRRKCTCRAIGYCDEWCQTKHWRVHKHHCSWRAGVRFCKAMSMSSIGPSIDTDVAGLLLGFLG